MKSFCVLCGRWLVIPKGTPTPIVCQVCRPPSKKIRTPR